MFNGHFRNLNFRNLPYIRPIFQAYVKDYPHKIWPSMVQVNPPQKKVGLSCAGGSNLRHGREGSSCTRGLGGQAALLGKKSDEVLAVESFVWRDLEALIPRGIFSRPKASKSANSLYKK